MKRASFAIIGISLLLTGCFGSSTDTKATEKTLEGFHSYSTEEIKLQIPNDWEVLTPKNTLVAFRSNIRNPMYTANVAIIRNELPAEASTLDYAKILYEKVKSELTEFHEILAEQIKTHVKGSETDTLFTVFEGRESPDADLKRFMQVSAVSGKKAYIATGSMLASEDEGVSKMLETMVRSFEVK